MQLAWHACHEHSVMLVRLTWQQTGANMKRSEVVTMLVSLNVLHFKGGARMLQELMVRRHRTAIAYSALMIAAVSSATFVVPSKRSLWMRSWSQEWWNRVVHSFDD